MILTYQPAGQDEPTRWTIHLGKLLSPEAEAIERVTGTDYGTSFQELLLKGNMRARRALLWVLQRRTHPTLKFDDVSFAHDELTLQLDRSEWTKLRTAAAESGADADVLALMDRELASAPEPEGKAPASDSAEVTG